MGDVVQLFKQPTRDRLIYDLIGLVEDAIGSLYYSKPEQEADLFSQFHRFVEVFLRNPLNLELPTFRITNPMLNGITFRWTPIGSTVMIYFFPFDSDHNMPFMLVNIITEKEATTIYTSMDEIEKEIAEETSLKFIVSKMGIPYHVVGDRL